MKMWVCQREGQTSFKQRLLAQEDGITALNQNCSLHLLLLTISQLREALILDFKLKRIGHFARVVKNIDVGDINCRHNILKFQILRMEFTGVAVWLQGSSYG